MTADPRVIELIMGLRGQGVTDERVLSAIERTPRALFVEESFLTEAYRDAALPIACGQTISQPYIVGFMTQALEIGPRMRVLEIGTGSGYQAAVLARLARMVYTIERHRPLLRQAERRFRALKLDNIVTRHGDGYQGWAEQAPFERIIATASFPEPPLTLVKQLKPGGILIAPVGKESISQDLVKMIRDEAGVRSERLLPVAFVPMVPGLPQEAHKPDDRNSKA